MLFPQCATVMYDDKSKVLLVVVGVDGFEPPIPAIQVAAFWGQAPEVLAVLYPPELSRPKLYAPPAGYR
jgi:hypothetical protein